MTKQQTTQEQIQLNGNNVFNVNFGLYNYDDINFNQSKENILINFKCDYEQKIKAILKTYGIKLVGLIYYSPEYYNFDNDSIDLIIKIADKKTLKKAILKQSDKIQEQLNKNCSYDGYMAITPYNIKEVLNNINNDDIDVITLRVLLNNIDFNDFDLNEYLIFEEEGL